MTTNPGHQNNYYSALKSDPIVDPEYDSDSDSTSSSSTSSSSSRSTSSSSNSDSTYSHTDTINDLNDELDRKESVIKQKDRKATRLISIIREKNMEIENLLKKNLDTQRSAWKSLADKNKELNIAKNERDQAITLHNEDSALTQQAIASATYYQNERDQAITLHNEDSALTQQAIASATYYQNLYYSTINNNSYYTNNIFDNYTIPNNYPEYDYDNINSNV